jgi:hypothetical protein
MLDEKALRKPAFRDGPQVKLADDQFWTFPRPNFRVFPADGPDGQVTTAWRPTYGSAYDRLLGVFLGADEVTTGELFEMRFRAASDLLRRNYDLATEHLAELLVFEEGDPASEARWTEIDGILVGSPQKKTSPSPSGCASAS